MSSKFAGATVKIADGTGNLSGCGLAPHQGVAYIGGMREDLSKTPESKAGEAIDPVAMARRDLNRKLPARFYKTVAVEPRENGFALTLDGRGARSPGGAPLVLPTQEAATLLAEEWEAQRELIDPAAMPVTRLVNSALDGVAHAMDAVREDIVKYAGSDLLCYRAGEPESLVAAQRDAWDPTLDWARDDLGALFILSEGVTFVTQPDKAIGAIRGMVEQARDPLTLAALSSMTSLTGSALLPIAVWRGRLNAQDAWTAAHVDEDYQMRHWGEDAEAMGRRARRWREMEAAAALLGPPQAS